eukprot:6189109-Pleurochrysis_carterae.AAC.2
MSHPIPTVVSNDLDIKPSRRALPTAAAVPPSSFALLYPPSPLPVAVDHLRRAQRACGGVARRGGGVAFAEYGHVTRLRGGCRRRRDARARRLHHLWRESTQTCRIT